MALAGWLLPLLGEWESLEFVVLADAAGGTTGGFAAGGPFPFAANLPVSVSQSVSLLKWGANYKFDPGFLFF